MTEQLRGPFEKFLDSPYSKKRPFTAPPQSSESSSYYSESEFCGGAVTVSFSNKVIPRNFQMALVFKR
jgi:hypothetical protein